MNWNQKAIRVLFGTLIVFGVLAATHKGEFWPYSIYPMFSKAGRPWTRALVRELPPTDFSNYTWVNSPLESLPGEAFALGKNGIDQIDFSNYVSKTKVWDADRVAGLELMLKRSLSEPTNLLVMKAEGRLTNDNSVIIRAVPALLFAADTTLINPTLPTK